jgi:hypothetical protein
MEKSILDDFKELSFNNKLDNKLKEERFMLKDESIIQNETSLIFNPPKNLSFLQDDGTLLDLVIKIYYSYIEINIKN